jgi:hypothetical protein
MSAGRSGIQTLRQYMPAKRLTALVRVTSMVLRIIDNTTKNHLPSKSRANSDYAEQKFQDLPGKWNLA